MNLETRVRRWLYGRLSGSAPLVAIVGANIGPAGSLKPGKGVAYALAGAEQVTPLGRGLPPSAEVFDWDIEAWGDGWSDLALEAAADEVDAALIGRSGEVGGVWVECEAGPATVAPEDVDGKRVAQRLGRRYRTFATRVS